MSDFVRETIKNHAKSIGRLLLVHMLAVALGWAAYPLFLTTLAPHMSIAIPLTVFSVIASLVYAAMLVSQGNEYGIQDTKPYNWARYKGKGFALGAAVGLVIYILVLICIAIANRHFYVNHPQFPVESINNYIRMIFCMPFFWFFKLVGKGDIMPRVTALTALFPMVFISGFAGLGYLFGRSGVVVDFRPKKKRG